MDFEGKLKKLEEIVLTMEKGDLSLENSMKAFEEGVRLSRECQTLLNESEQKVRLLLEVTPEGEVIDKEFPAPLTP